MTASPRPYTGRVVEIHDFSPDTRKIVIEIEHKQRMNFTAGQYARLSLPGFENRPYSIASSPHEPHLEFHIKNSGRGLSAHILETLKPGGTINVEGPFGTNYWRADDRPLLAIGGGLGIVPLKSIIDTCLHAKSSPPVHLYWGTRLKDQLYMDGHFRHLNKKHPRFSYIPVLSEETGSPSHRTGFPAAAAAEDFETLSGLSIYMAGPQAMIDAALPVLLQKGAEEDYVFSDGFTL